MSKFSVYTYRLLIIVISIVLINNLIITYVDTSRNEFKESTSVGNVYLGGLPKTNISEYIEPKVNNYLNKLELKYTFNNQVYSSSIDFVEYDETLTNETILDGHSTNFVFNINTNKLKLHLSKHLPRYIFNSIDYERLNSDLLNHYTSLKPIAEIYIKDYINDFDSLKEELNSYTYFDNDVSNLVDDLKDVDIIIEANSRFSILDTFRPLGLSSDELNILATGINAVAIETNFSSYIKSNSRIPYTKVNHDIEAIETSVNKTQNKDFSFYNPFDFTYEIKVTEIDGGLKFSLIGIPFEKEYGYLIEEESIPYIPLDYGEVIPKGATLISGIDGKEIKVYRYILENGKVKNKELLYTNYFGPRNESFEE